MITASIRARRFALRKLLAGRIQQGIAWMSARIGVSGTLPMWSRCSRTMLTRRTSCLLVAAGAGLVGLVVWSQQSSSEAEFAARVANDECERLYGERPFSARTYPLRTENERFHWGHLDPAGEKGFSAEVSFRRIDEDIKVRVFYSSDAATAPPRMRHEMEKRLNLR